MTSRHFRTGVKMQTSATQINIGLYRDISFPLESQTSRPKFALITFIFHELSLSNCNTSITLLEHISVAKTFRPDLANYASPSEVKV